MRTLDDIIPPSRRPTMPAAPGEPPRRPPPLPPRGNRTPYVIIVVALLVIAGSVAALLHFSSAKIEITPTVSSLQVNTTLTAGPTGDVPFTIVSAKKTAQNAIPATGTKQASDAASGTITIYNTQGKTQPLIANTRFATDAGLIYRIHTGVTVPAGSASAPGTVSATVYADKPGETYNIGPSSFTVPGLAGTPEASAVYARSTAPITGGATGSVPVVDPGAEQGAASALESSLAAELPATLQAPEGYVLLPGAATTTYHELSPTAAEGEPGKANVIVEATVTGVAFPSSALAAAIASSSATSAGATLGQGTSLTVTPSSDFPATNGDSFTFTLSGTASLVATVDSGQIATAVAGKTKSQAQTALGSYPEVQRAVLVLRPFWRSTFPADPAAITVITTPPTAP